MTTPLSTELPAELSEKKKFCPVKETVGLAPTETRPHTGLPAWSLKVNFTGTTADNPAQTVVINKPISAPTDWFSIDNHHHGTRSDAFSPPEVVAKAQVTAGLEVPTLDDHQYVLDNCPVYDWSRKLGATGYMPSEEVTPSWGHHDIMPMTGSAYTRFRDCAQENPIVNTNATHQGILDDAHNAGVAIGANHPNSDYGLLLADDNHTVPGASARTSTVSRRSSRRPLSTRPSTSGPPTGAGAPTAVSR